MSDVNLNTTPDEKTISKIKKLLNLSRDGGATEGEANTAMALAEQIMLANNLSMAQVEMSGGAAVESRGKTQTRGKANYRWQRWIMTAIAEANFCHLGVITGQRKIRHGYRDISLGYELIGRISNVTAAQNMYEYLLQTCARLRDEYEAQPGNGASEGALFTEGLAYRLAERVQERHKALLEEQRKEAERQKKETAARSSHPAYAGSSNALVVVMADYEQAERDLNTDLRYGLPRGTTAAKRAEREAKSARQDQEMVDLQKSGVSYDVAYYMVHMGWSRERSEEYVKKSAEEEKSQGKKSRWRGGGRTREDRLHERLYTGAAGDGRRRAEDVSLSAQLDKKSNRRLS